MINVFYGIYIASPIGLHIWNKFSSNDLEQCLTTKKGKNSPIIFIIVATSQRKDGFDLLAVEFWPPNVNFQESLKRSRLASTAWLYSFSLHPSKQKRLSFLTQTENWHGSLRCYPFGKDTRM